jgi:hypothetical protein
VREPLFVGDVPARITTADFRRYYLQAFPDLADAQYDDIIKDAIEAVYIIFLNVGHLWEREIKQVYYDKTVLCFRLLTAWYIADMYPMFVSGVPVMGGIPIKRKKIGGVDITFPDGAATGGNKDFMDYLSFLKSNPWGGKAYGMIRPASKIMQLRNSPLV